MASIAFIFGQILFRNGFNLMECTDPSPIPCQDVQTRGVEWAVPVVRNGVLTGYEMRRQPTKPQPDAIKTVKVVAHGTTEDVFNVYIGDNGTEQEFVDKCNGCCADDPNLPTGAYPTPIVEMCQCKDAAGNYTHHFHLPDNPNGLLYGMTGSVNGAYLAPYPGNATDDTPAEVLAWVQANWGAAGVWSLQSGNKMLRLVSPTAECAGLQIRLKPTFHCLVLPAVATVADSVTIGGEVVPITPGTVVSRDNPWPLLQELQRRLQGAVTVRVPAAVGSQFSHIEYEGLQLPTAIKDGSTTVATFAAGACPV
jgi:hypothetical protein